MKKRWLFVVWVSLQAGAESLLKPVNDLGYGTFSARLQTLSMHRDFENAVPGNAYSTTAGLLLGYTSPELNGLSLGLAYNYVEPLDYSSGNNKGRDLIRNGRLSILNEGWLKYRLETFGLTNTFVKAGRQVLNGEVFRADEIRQKARSFEAVLLTTKDIPYTALTVGHITRLSNVWGNKDDWKFKDLDEVLTPGRGYDSRGISWAEAVYTGITNLELVAYDAFAHDIANVAGGRFRYAVTEKTAVTGCYQHENSVQTADRRDPFRTDMFGLALQQKAGPVTLEPGWFSVHGDNLLFSETTTGLNHPLGNSLLIYGGHFNGGSDTAYFKATAKAGKNSLYMLYNYTWQDHGRTPFDGQEINFIISRPFGEHLSVAVKCGAGYRDGKRGTEDTVATDSRLFITYKF